MDPERNMVWGSDSGWRRDILAAALAVILSLAAYAGTLDHELVWDDAEIVRYIDSIVLDGGLPALVTSQFATHIEEGYVSGYYRPVPVVSLWFDSNLAPSFPWIYHLTNVLLHAFNTLLVYIILRLLNVRLAAAVGSMIFAVHPVHSESVSFVSGRTDLWSALFVLLAVAAWIRERKGISAVPFHDRFRSLAAFFMACLSKEVAFVLPAVLLVWDWSSPGLRGTGRSGWWPRNRGWIVGWTAVLAVVMFLRFTVFGPDLGLVQIREGEMGPGGNAFTLIPRMLLMYVRLLVLPWPLKVYYGPAQLQVTAAMILGVSLFLSLVLYIFFRCSRESAVQGVVWIVLLLVPVLGLGSRGGALLAERFLYLPSIGFCLLAGALAAGLTADRRAVTAATGLLVLLMMFGTVNQSAVWKNEVTLFEEFVRIAPGTAGGHYNLGNAYAGRGRQREAVRAYRRALELDGHHYRARFNMGNALSALGRYGEAAEAYRQALRVKPDLIPGYINLGVALMEQGEYGDSAAVYREGIRRAPGETALHLGLVVSYLRGGSRQSALDHLKSLEKTDRALADVIRGSLPEGEIED